MSPWRTDYIAYVRVSSYEQAERNLSIPSQVDQIERYAKQNGIRVDRIFSEEHSAYKGSRPIFAEMLKEIRKNRNWKGVIVFKFDRVSRNLDDFLALEKLMKERGMEVVSVTEPMLNSYLGRYMVRDIQNRAILYSEELSFRIKLGLRKKLQTGGDIGGSPPFWFKRVDGYFVPDERKGPVIERIFSMYGTGLHGYKEIAKAVRREFGLKHVANSTVQRIVTNSIYAGIRTKTWNLSTEEYLFWGASAPGEFTEAYPLAHVKPIVSQEDFERCERIRIARQRWPARTGSAKFPKIFECFCGRKLARDDKKGKRYLRCPRQLNARFPVPCLERYSSIERLEPYLESVLREVVLTPEIRQAAAVRLMGESARSHSSDRQDTYASLQEIEALQEKLDRLTERYVAGTVSDEAFETLGAKLDTEMRRHKDRSSLANRPDDLQEANKRTIRFLEAIWAYARVLDLPPWPEKSSQLFSVVFKVVANLVFKDWFPQRKALSAPFDLVQKGWISDWWRWRVPPPCLGRPTRRLYAHIVLLPGLNAPQPPRRKGRYPCGRGRALVTGGRSTPDSSGTLSEERYSNPSSDDRTGSVAGHPALTDLRGH